MSKQFYSQQNVDFIKKNGSPGFYIQFSQSFAEETFSYDEY